jgi:hydrocephalus-inducing protein
LLFAAATSDAGVEVEVSVTYEPAEIGESKDTLKVAAPQGGEYIFPLRGICVAPKPQGPVLVKAGGSAQIAFKNVFSAQQEFRITVDNPQFTVKDKEVVPAKKPLAIAVAYKPTGDARKETTAKLVITCGTLPPWVYYLKGVPA